MVNDAGVGPEHRLVRGLEQEKSMRALVFTFPSTLWLLRSYLADYVDSDSD